MTGTLFDRQVVTISVHEWSTTSLAALHGYIYYYIVFQKVFKMMNSMQLLRWHCGVFFGTTLTDPVTVSLLITLG